jgi:hypothetical protein
MAAMDAITSRCLVCCEREPHYSYSYEAIPRQKYNLARAYGEEGKGNEEKGISDSLAKTKRQEAVSKLKF